MHIVTRRIKPIQAGAVVATISTLVRKKSERQTVTRAHSKHNHVISTHVASPHSPFWVSLLALMPPLPTLPFGCICVRCSYMIITTHVCVHGARLVTKIARPVNTILLEAR